jgi:hypothetical protein
VPELIIEDDINVEHFNDRDNIFFHTEDNNSSSLNKLKINYNK